ncbi:MAG: hypothetical protein IKP22_08810 [Clostridia bacterium]|nr:hypothetical protein [Clostridia bacterium]
MDDQNIKVDRMRYSKNTQSSRLALLAIVLDVLFFVSIYKYVCKDTTRSDEFYYTALMGASILYNLVFMLAAFLSSEGVKNYKTNFSYVMFVLAAIQIARIFIYPVKAHSQPGLMSDFQFIRLIVYLVASALCLVAGALINLGKSRALAAHTASLEAGKA